MSEESKSWYRMTQPVFNSGFEGDEFLAYGQDGFQEILYSYLGSDVLLYDKNLQNTPQQIRAIIQQKTSDIMNSTVMRQILCNIGILKCGQYVKDGDMTWLVCTLPDNNRVYEKALLWMCVCTIRFLSPLTGEIVEYPVYSTNSTQYGTGVANRSQIDVGEDQHLVYLPYNAETILLDDGFRFIMDKNNESPTVYYITRVDSVSYAVGDGKYSDGLIQWAVLEDKFNEATDSREEMVADYKQAEAGGTENIPGTSATLTLTDLDGDFMIAVGEQKQIRVECVDDNGDPIIPPVYRLEYDFSDGAVDIVDDTDGVITLQASNNRAFVGHKVEIQAINDALGCEAAIKIQIVNG